MMPPIDLRVFGWWKDKASEATHPSEMVPSFQLLLEKRSVLSNDIEPSDDVP